MNPKPRFICETENVFRLSIELESKEEVWLKREKNAVGRHECFVYHSLFDELSQTCTSVSNLVYITRLQHWENVLT